MTARRVVLAVTALAGYAIAAIWLNRLAADQPFTLGFVGARDAQRSERASTVHGSPHLAGSFGAWFPLSADAAPASARPAGSSAAGWRRGATGSSRRRVTAAARTSSCGVRGRHTRAVRAPPRQDATSSRRTATRSSPTVSSAASRSCRVTRSDAPKRLRELVDRFVEYAARARLAGRDSRRVRALARALPRARPAALYHGDEALVDTASFSLEGRPIRKVRQSVQRLAQAGYARALVAPSEARAVLNPSWSRSPPTGAATSRNAALRCRSTRSSLWATKTRCS